MDAEHSSDACPKYVAILEDYLEGELSGRAALDVKSHLLACPACQEALELARTGAHLLRIGLEPAGEPGPAFARRVMAGIRAEEQQRSAPEDRLWRPLEALAWRMTLSAALALTVLVVYGLKMRPSPPAFTTTSQLRAASLLESVQQPSTGDDVLLSLAESQNAHGR